MHVFPLLGLTERFLSVQGAHTLSRARNSPEILIPPHVLLSCQLSLPLCSSVIQFRARRLGIPVSGAVSWREQ